MNCNYLFFLFLLTFILIPVYSEPKKNKKDKGVSSWFQWSKVQASLKTASNKFVKATEKLEDIIFGESCPYVDRPAEAVRKKLQSGIKAQPMVIDAVTDHIKGWYSTDKPLVLAFTGPTGVGKTETAVLLAEAILKKKVRMSRRGRMIPKGLLVFQGADFADSSISRSEYHIRITSQLANMLRKCGNHAVVIFDEVQKVTSGVLDVLLESMSEHPRLTYYNYKTKETEIFDTSKVIFILISDVGGTRMFELVLEKNGRENIKKSYVQNEIRKIMRKN
jgi:DNA polymerase III delta prime subunit